MRYEILVSSNRKDDPMESVKSFEEKYADTDEKVQKLSDDANQAYVAATRKYDSNHVVFLARDGVCLHNAIGVGAATLDVKPSPEDADDAVNVLHVKDGQASATSEAVKKSASK